METFFVHQKLVLAEGITECEVYKVQNKEYLLTHCIFFASNSQSLKRHFYYGNCLDYVN